MRTPTRALVVLLAAACSPSRSAADDEHPSGGSEAAPAAPAGKAVAIFAGGCFWCMETAFEDVPGVESVLSGYAGGQQRAPTYDQVSSGRTGHAEAVRVLYDPDRLTYAQLLAIFWRNVDPVDAGGQFCDRGTQYRSAIFPVNTEQRRVAERSMRAIEEQLGRAVATRIERADAFWIAEEYHQDFYRKDPVRYRTYRAGCGRDARLRELWGQGGH